jgi:hypothetical protein
VRDADSRLHGNRATEPETAFPTDGWLLNDFGRPVAVRPECPVRDADSRLHGNRATEPKPRSRPTAGC